MNFNIINPAYWVNKYVDKRINNYGKGVGTEMKYNPLLVTMDNTHTDKHMTRRILENGIWYSGIEQDLQYFYRTEAPKFYRNGMQSESINYFWSDADNDFRKIHSGFPQLISEKMVDLIMGNGYSVTVEAKDKEEELNETLKEILKDNSFNLLMNLAIETESWSGGAPFKLSKNPLISDYPIIEVWQAENYSNVVVSGRIVKDIFYTYYTVSNTRYRLSEMYSVDKEGAYIDYKLEQLVFDSKSQNTEPKWMDVSLNTIENTKELKRITFKGYFTKLSLYKPNKLPNSEFRYSVLGESDYSGSYGAFDAIDEILSTWIQEFRDGKLNRYFPENLVPKNKSGNNNLPSDFKKDHILYQNDPNNDKGDKIQYEQGEVRTDKHEQSYKIWAMLLLNNAGLSPLTIGMTGLESIDASAESQQEREKVSIRTRGKKIELWIEFLARFLKTTLEFHEMTKDMTMDSQGMFTAPTPIEFEVIPMFEDYILKTKADRTTEATEGVGGKTWDIKSAVDYIHEDKSDKEKLSIVANIKLENNIDAFSVAEASALQATEETAQEMLEEEGVEILEIDEEVEEEIVEEEITEVEVE